VGDTEGVFTMGDVDALRLATGAHVFLRGRDAVQFGLDATRAGIVETTHAPMLVAGLLSARRPRTRSELRTVLHEAGLGREAAASLLDDLEVYRILVPVTEYQVVLLGRGRLAEATSALLRGSGVTVRQPVKGESEFVYLAEADIDRDPPVPVIVADRLAHSKAMAPMLSRFARTWVPGAIVDQRGMVGPVRMDGRGPCPLCADLHRTDVDGFWHRVVTQMPGGPSQPDPVVVAATAARLAAWALALCGAPAPPGRPPVIPAPGQVVTVDPYGGDESDTWGTHRRCPVCF